MCVKIEPILIPFFHSIYEKAIFPQWIIINCLLRIGRQQQQQESSYTKNNVEIQMVQIEWTWLWMEQSVY